MKIKKNIFHILILFVLVVMFFPTFSTYASVVDPNEPCNNSTVASSTNQPCQLGGGGLVNLLQKAQTVLNAILPVLVALGVVYFVWGVVQYVIGDSEEAKTKGRDRIIYGIIGLAVIVGLWGLVAILRKTFGLDTNSTAPTSTELQNLLPH